MVTISLQLKRTYRNFSSQADLREKNKFEVLSYFSQNGRFMSVKNKISHVLNFFTRFDIDFSLCFRI